MFLMYRVELKVRMLNSMLHNYFAVPNVPCGVESFKDDKAHIKKVVLALFLMYRVELKVAFLRGNLDF